MLGDASAGGGRKPQFGAPGGGGRGHGSAGSGAGVGDHRREAVEGHGEGSVGGGLCPSCCGRPAADAIPEAADAQLHDGSEVELTVSGLAAGPGVGLELLAGLPELGLAERRGPWGEASDEEFELIEREVGPGQDITEATDTNVESGKVYRYRVYALKPTPEGPRGTGTSNVVTAHAWK